MGLWQPLEIDGLENIFGQPFMPLTGGASAIPIREFRDPSWNAPSKCLGDLNVDLTLGGEGVTVATTAPEDSGESDPALDQTIDEVVDELADEGNQALAEEARENVSKTLSRPLRLASPNG